MSSRRRFLGALGAGAILPALPTIGAAATPGGSPVPTSADWDMSWVAHITGTHRAVFDVPEYGEGSGVWRANAWPGQVREVYGGGVTVSTVLVLRHNAIDFIMNDAYWARFPIGEEAEWKAPRSEDWITTNPVREMLGRFHEAGGITLGCDLAFRFVVNRYRGEGEARRPAADVRPEATADMLPGITILPSGFFAAIAAQEAGCKFMPG